MLVALLSTYREGPLAAQAVRSARAATEHVIVFEGPAGPRLENEDDCPPTTFDTAGVTILHGEWKTDAAKRTAMIEHCRRYRGSGPVWGVWIDGDELLVNGEYLADHLRHVDWLEEAERAKDPDAAPFMGWPIKLVELDGGVTVCRGKVVRVDLIDSYSVSSSVFKNALGHLHGEGNHPLDYTEHTRPLRDYIRSLPIDSAVRRQAESRLWLPPPLPGEPFLVHRSALRHPARAGLRLHEQEAVELEKAKARDGL